MPHEAADPEDVRTQHHGQHLRLERCSFNPKELASIKLAAAIVRSSRSRSEEGLEINPRGKDLRHVHTPWSSLQRSSLDHVIPCHLARQAGVEMIPGHAINERQQVVETVRIYGALHELGQETVTRASANQAQDHVAYSLWTLADSWA